MIAIIGVLVSLLFPALSSVREAGRRASCQNNLRNLGLATQQYAEHHRDALPALWHTNRQRPWQNFSWRVKLLPYLELQNVYDTFDLNALPLDRENLATAQLGISMFECPSTPGAPRRIASIGYADSIYEDCQVAASDYTAVFEVQLPDRRFPAHGAWNGAPDLQMELEAPDASLSDRLNPSTRRVPASMAGIRDGLSNTILVVEQAGKPSHLGISVPRTVDEPSEGPWATAEYSTFTGEGINRDNQQGPFAFHNLAQVVMCDASVHALSAEIAPAVLRALMTANGREIIQDNDWR